MYFNDEFIRWAQGCFSGSAWQVPRSEGQLCWIEGVLYENEGRLLQIPSWNRWWRQQKRWNIFVILFASLTSTAFAQVSRDWVEIRGVDSTLKVECIVRTCNLPWDVHATWNIYVVLTEEAKASRRTRRGAHWSEIRCREKLPGNGTFTIPLCLFFHVEWHLWLGRCRL